MNRKHTFLVHFFVTLFLTGNIWFIQFIHYPLLFKLVSTIHNFNTSFGHYFSTELVQLTRYLSLPFILELLTGLILFKPKKGIKTPLFLKLSFLLILTIWAIIGIVQLPLLLILRKGYHIFAFKSLLTSTWILSILWTIRSGLLTITLWKYLPSSTQSKAAHTEESSPITQ